jgi:hypothetical protein
VYSRAKRRNQMGIVVMENHWTFSQNDRLTGASVRTPAAYEADQRAVVAINSANGCAPGLSRWRHAYTEILAVIPADITSRTTCTAALVTGIHCHPGATETGSTVTHVLAQVILL